MTHEPVLYDYTDASVRIFIPLSRMKLTDFRINHGNNWAKEMTMQTQN